MPNCELCGDPMPQGEDMFKYHGYSGPCPKPPRVRRVSYDEKTGARENDESQSATVEDDRDHWRERCLVAERNYAQESARAERIRLDRDDWQGKAEMLLARVMRLEATDTPSMPDRGGATGAAAHSAVETTDEVASGAGDVSTGAGETPAQAGSSVPPANESGRLRTLIARAQEIDALPEDTDTQEAVKYNRALGLIEALLEAYGTLVGVAPGVGVTEHLRCNDCGAIDNDDTGICHAEDCLSGNLAVEVSRPHLSRLTTAIENWGRHFDWCAIKRSTVLAFVRCDCGLIAEIEYARSLQPATETEAARDV